MRGSPSLTLIGIWLPGVILEHTEFCSRHCGSETALSLFGWEAPLSAYAGPFPQASPTQLYSRARACPLTLDSSSSLPELLLLQLLYEWGWRLNQVSGELLQSLS